MKDKPIYLSISEDIVSSIKKGELKSGDKIMTELELSKKYQVSRATVNKAISNLAIRGYVTRTAGKGSYVSEKVLKNIKKTNRSEISSFSKDMEEIHKVPGAKLINYSVLQAKDIPDIASKLSIEEDELVHYINRVRTGDNKPIAISYTYIPYKLLPTLDVRVLNGSLYEYIYREYQITPQPTDYTFQAVMPNDKQKKLLELQSDICLLKSCHISETQDQKIFEYTETFYIGNKYTYHLSLK